MEIISDFTVSVRKALEEIDSKYESYNGLVIAGTHAPTIETVEQQIQKVKEARESGTPTLLICHGQQVGAIEYARNVLGIKDATSEEYGAGTFVVKKRDALKVGLHEGESWWSYYEVAIDVKNPPHFIATASHPEYTSSIDKPHPLLIHFLSLCKK